MKKYIVIALIVLVGGALLIGPLLNSGGTDPSGGGSPVNGGLARSLPAQFKTQGNMAAICNAEQNVEIAVNQKDIASIEVSFDGNVLQTWDNPTQNVNVTFTPTNVGTFSFDLNVTTKDGKLHRDERSLRVVSDIQPKTLKADIVQTFKHDPQSFTQGLEFDKGRLYEGVGQYGQSRVMEVDLSTGDIKRKQGLDGNYFGEGITLMNDKLYQLTWQNGKCFVYDYQGEAFVLEKDLSYIGEGWGLCNNGTELIMSDGSESIYFRDPENFQEIRRIQVYSDRGPIPQLNELEYIDGKIYANVYMTNLVIAIDPTNGKVLEMIYCDDLVAQGRGAGDVLNGIAQNDINGKIYMTGKNWPSLFEVTFSPYAVP